MSQQQSARASRSVGGMVVAMVVMVVLISAYVALTSWKSDAPDSPVRAVDYRSAVPSARTAAPFDLLAPPSLPRGWRATTVSFTGAPGAHWHLGLLTDHDRYVGLEQGDASVSTMVTDYVDEGATRGGSVQVAGRPWASYTDGQGDLALIRRDGRTTTLVIGHEVPRSTLVTYLQSLR